MKDPVPFTVAPITFVRGVFSTGSGYEFSHWRFRLRKRGWIDKNAVHLSEISLETTKACTHGALLFDRNQGLIGWSAALTDRRSLTRNAAAGA